MMEFEEMQKVWDEQKGETMYVINETALHHSVTKKKDATARKINRVEINLTIVNSAAAIFLLVIALQGEHNWAFISSGLMVATIAYIQYSRQKRKKAENNFDRSMLGELDQAILNSESIIKVNYFVMAGYLIPLAVLNMSKMIFGGASLTKWLITSAALLLALIVVRWEQKACNFPRRKQLLALRKKLIEV